ncbi:MAG: hypothetical protein ACREAA_11960 [Candidatus Polarisedimenticolia bacterium]
MSAAPGYPDRRIEPEFLGPLGERPLADGSGPAGPDEIFPGASAFLSRRQQQRRRAQWDLVRPLAGKLLEPAEHVVYVAHGVQVPPILHTLSMGAIALAYHQVILVFTDKRIIEVLLGFQGRKAATRLRSFPWMSVKGVKLKFGKLTVAPVQGRKQAWRVPVRGDRKLLALLMPRVKPLLMPQGAMTANPIPLVHCPGCGSTLSDAAPPSCESCRITFRSPRLAAALSMAFPGAGLLYAGHPFLAAADFLGEVILYLLFLMLIVEAEPSTAMIVIAVGAVLFIMTKLESVHLSRILSARSKPEPEPRRNRYRRFGLIGALASLIVIGGAFPLMGAGRPVVDRDLDVVGEGNLWEKNPERAEWVAFAGDPTARSQWSHADGSMITLFAYPQRLMDSTSEFRNSLRAEFLQRGVTILKDDEDVPSPFRGFRFVMTEPTEDGNTLAQAHYFVVDEDNRDIHHVLAAAIEPDGSVSEALAGDLLTHARWSDTREPAPAP